jgi:hypothetical protein
MRQEKASPASVIGFDNSAMPNFARCRDFYPEYLPRLSPQGGQIQTPGLAGWVRIRAVFCISLACRDHGQTHILSSCCLSRSERQIIGILLCRYASQEQRQASLLDTVVDQDTLKRNILIVANAVAKYIHPKAAAFDVANVEVRMHAEALIKPSADLIEAGLIDR